MKPALSLFVALTLSGCSHGSTPTAPNTRVTTGEPVSGASLGSVSGAIVEPGGTCIENAIVEVVRGQRQGQRIMQDTSHGCDGWGGVGFYLEGLNLGTELTLRASAPGLSSDEKTVLPKSPPMETVIFVLHK